jgi:hypothetical protein
MTINRHEPTTQARCPVPPTDMAFPHGIRRRAEREYSLRAAPVIVEESPHPYGRGMNADRLLLAAGGGVVHTTLMAGLALWDWRTVSVCSESAGSSAAEVPL